MDSAIRELGTCHPAVCRERCVGLGGAEAGARKQATERTLGCKLRSSVQPSAHPSRAAQPLGEGAATVSCVDCGLAAAPGTGRVPPLPFV